MKMFFYVEYTAQNKKEREIVQRSFILECNNGGAAKSAKPLKKLFTKYNVFWSPDENETPETYKAKLGPGIDIPLIRNVTAGTDKVGYYEAIILLEAGKSLGLEYTSKM